MRIHHILIPLLTALVAWAGSRFTSSGITNGWYAGILKPVFTPPGFAIGIVWTVIFILACMSAILVWGHFPTSNRIGWIAGIFVANGILNICWSYLFFSQHLLMLSAWEATALGVSVLVLIVLIWPISRVASVLLIPYAGWVMFATYLTFVIAQLNK